jgi:hypothetical protein
MNLVKQILDQLSGGAFGQLASLLGTDAKATERAAEAAVPSLLSVLANMASTNDGARKLTNALGALDTGSLGNIAQMFGSNASSVLGQGTSLLGSVLGDSVVSGLSSTLGRFTGLNSGVVKSLLAYLMPLVLGKVATQWKNQGGSTSALTNLFAEQRDNIANAVPDGFSLDDIPSVSEVRTSAYSTARKLEREPVAAGSPARWIIPLALALLGGYLLWQYLPRAGADRAVANRVDSTAREVTAMKPSLPAGIEVPSLTGVRDELSGMFKSLDTAFTDIRDAASAERAMPALRELNAKIDSMDQMLARLPETARATLRPAIEEQVKVVSEKARSVSTLDGIGAQFRELIQEIVAKVTRWITARAG